MFDVTGMNEDDQDELLTMLFGSDVDFGDAGDRGAYVGVVVALSFHCRCCIALPSILYVAVTTSLKLCKYRHMYTR